MTVLNSEEQVSTELLQRLGQIGLPDSMSRTFVRRRVHSAARLAELEGRLYASGPLLSYPDLAVYAAGSYARGDASEHSDIDLFFIHDDHTVASQVANPRIKTVRVMAAIVHEIEEMQFPAPSNDGEYLRIRPLSEILKHLGGAEDDHENHFTARMLLMLESAPVFGRESYHSAIERIVESYLRDYEDHAADFRPIFLANDILRYWKTICLNYEHRRNQAEDAKKIKQKIRNFKLGHSRLLTCFATIALLSSYNNIDREELVRVCKLTPVDRLLELAGRQPPIGEFLLPAMKLYHWFLEKTEMTAPELERYFSERENRVLAFRNAREFGDRIFDIVRTSASWYGNFQVFGCMIKRRKYFYGVYMRNEEIATSLDLIRFIGDPGAIRFSHVTLRGPYTRALGKARLDQINADGRYDWNISLTKPVTFFSGSQCTVAIEVELHSLRELFYKPDFPDGVPHITIYDGSNKAFARELFTTISHYEWSARLSVSRLRKIEPKKRIDEEILPFFMSFHSLYGRIVGDPRNMRTAWAMSLDERLLLVNKVMRGQEGAARLDEPASPQRVLG